MWAQGTLGAMLTSGRDAKRARARKICQDMPVDKAGGRELLVLAAEQGCTNKGARSAAKK